MDWHKLISQIELLQKNDLGSVDLEKGSTQPLERLNRAIRQLQSGNGDVALIALRRLTGMYPRFGPAFLVLGLCLALDGQALEAERVIRHALDNNLRTQDIKLAETVLEGLSKRQPTSTEKQSLKASPAMRRSPLTGAGLLEKTGGKQSVRMASNRERQEVMQKRDRLASDETQVKARRSPVEILRIALPSLAIVIIAGVIVFFGVRFIGGYRETTRENQANEQRLSWLLSKLENMNGSDEVDALLDQYRMTFESQSAETTPIVETTETVIETTIETTLATTIEPTMSPTTDIEPDLQSLMAAVDDYRQAVIASEYDLMLAGNFLLGARRLLAGLPPETKTDIFTAYSLSSEVEEMIARIGQDAAELNRRQGMTLYNQKSYEEALGYFTEGYELYPRSYGGGTAYYCGRCYQFLGDYEQARPYYEFVVEQFPGRDIAASAEARLREMIT